MLIRVLLCLSFCACGFAGETAKQPASLNLKFAPGPRPWGDSFVPRSKPPARRLLAVDVKNLKPEERIAITCLQGLTSRQEPKIWILREGLDQDWLDWHKEKKHIDGYDVVTNWAVLLDQYSNVCQGAIIADTNLYRGELLALNIASCEDLIIATPELAQKLKLPVKIDLRGRFTNYADGLNWVWDKYKD